MRTSRSGEPIRVMLVDDHAVVRVGLANLVREAPGMTVVGEAGSCGEALGMASRVNPDVVVLDVRLPDGTGLDLIAPLKAAVVGLRVVILTSYADDSLVLAALRMGADGYLLKDVTAGELVAGLRRSMDSGVVSPALPAGDVGVAARTENLPGGALTGQERRVCEQVGRGFSNREVAESIGISEKTVRNYLTRAFDKLGVRRRSELVALFVARKFGRSR